MFADSLVALVTPMTADEAIDLPAWQRLIEFHIVHGTAGVVVGGTTGESATLTEAELLQLVREAQAVAAGRLQVIAGAGLSSTAATVERVRALAPLRPDGLLVVTPASTCCRRPSGGSLRCPTSSPSRKPSPAPLACANCGLRRLTSPCSRGMTRPPGRRSWQVRSG